VAIGDAFQVSAVMKLVDMVSGPLKNIRGEMATAEDSATSLRVKMANLGQSMKPLAIGAGVGAALGILFAPDTGANTRDKLSFKLSKYKKELEELIGDLVEGKDFYLQTHDRSGYTSLKELKSLGINSVQVRYSKLRKTSMINLKEIGE
jgi:gas vesicle protein